MTESNIFQFQGPKGQKGCLNTNFQMQNFVEPNTLSYDPKECFELLFDQNWAGSCRTTILKAQMSLEGQKIEEFLTKNCKLH